MLCAINTAAVCAPLPAGANTTTRFEIPPGSTAPGGSTTENAAEPFVVQPVRLNTASPRLVMANTFVIALPGRTIPKSVPAAAEAGTPLLIATPLVPSTAMQGPV